jgi:AraC-like DNA-binding protein
MSPRELTEEEKQRIVFVKSFLENHLRKQFGIRELARKAALGEQKFKDGFYQLFEMNAGEYIHATKMKTGRFLLLNTGKGIKEIASLCGYSKTRNFSSAYKKYFKISPSEERK